MKDKVLIITPCSERKRRGGDPALTWKREKSAAARLSSKSASRLIESRMILRRRFRFPDGKDLGGQRDGPAPLLLASRRYDGNLYRKIDEPLWADLSASKSVDLLIVSTLYGIVMPGESIREYDLPMNRAFVRLRLSMRQWWINRGIRSLLAEFVRRNGYSVVHDFQSSSYVRVADINDYDPLYSHGKNVVLRHHTYPGLGSGADHHRGRDVKSLLEKYLQ
jgi:hypothetical protein